MDNSALPPISSGVSVHNKSCDESIFCEADVRAAQTKMAIQVVGDKAQAQSTESKILPNNEGKRAEKRKSEKVKDSSKMHDASRAMLDQVLQNQNTFNKSIGDLGNNVKVFWKDRESYQNEFDQDHDPVDEVCTPNKKANRSSIDNEAGIFDSSPRPNSDYGYANAVPSTSIPQSDNSNSSSFADILSKYKQAEKTGPNVNSGLADSINSLYADGLPDNGLKELMEKHSRPDSCTRLTEVRVNDLIWVLLNSFNQAQDSQAQDSRFQIFQNCLVTAGVKVTKLLDILTKHASGDVSQFVDLGMDALAVLGHGHRQLCLHRRELIKPHLSRQYVHLC